MALAVGQDPVLAVATLPRSRRLVATRGSLHAGETEEVETGSPLAA